MSSACTKFISIEIEIGLLHDLQYFSTQMEHER